MSNWYIKSQVGSSHDYDLLEEYGTPEDIELAKARKKLDKKFEDKRQLELEKMAPVRRKKPTNPPEFLSIKFDDRYLDRFISAVAQGIYQSNVSYFYDGKPLKYEFRDTEYEKLCDQYRKVEPISVKRPVIVKRLKQLIVRSMPKQELSVEDF